MSAGMKPWQLDGRPGALVWFPFDRDFNASLKSQVSPGLRAWLPPEKAWWFHEAAVPLVTDMVADWFGLQLKGPPPPARESREDRRRRLVKESYGALHVAPGAPEEVIRAAHKALALKHHPDRGGSTEAMQRVNAALDAILEDLR